MQVVRRLFAALAAVGIAMSAQASVLPTTTEIRAADVSTFGTFHDNTTNFVFVKLPDRWAFVGQDAGADSHLTFHDAATGFVYVKLSTGWKFIGTATAEA